jgi:hypothetical protein
LTFLAADGNSYFFILKSQISINQNLKSGTNKIKIIMEPSPLLPKRAYLEDTPCLDIPMDVFANSASKGEGSSWGPQSLKSPREMVRNSYTHFQTKKDEILETLK